MRAGSTLLAACAAPCLLAGPCLLASCGREPAAGQGAAASLPPGPHIQLAIEADPTTHYEMLCDVRTYQVAPGQFANRYGVDTKGPFKDIIPSPNAHCTAKIDSGPAPIKVSLTKLGATQSMTIDAGGDAGKKTLHIW